MSLHKMLTEIYLCLVAGSCKSLRSLRCFVFYRPWVYLLVSCFFCTHMRCWYRPLLPPQVKRCNQLLSNGISLRPVPLKPLKALCFQLVRDLPLKWNKLRFDSESYGSFHIFDPNTRLLLRKFEMLLTICQEYKVTI